MTPLRAVDLSQRDDVVSSWIKLERATRRVIGNRLKDGESPNTDDALDKLIRLRGLAARWLVN